MDDAVDGLPDDPRAGDGHQDGFAKSGEVFDFAVTVGVIFVSRLVAYLDREEGERGANQIETRMRCIRKHAEGAGEQADAELEKSHDSRGNHGVAGYRALLG